MRRIVRFIAKFLNFLCKRGAVIAFRIVGKEISLALVIPVVGSESLRFLEMWNSVGPVTRMIEVLGEAEFGVSRGPVRVHGSQMFPELSFSRQKGASITIGDPIANRVKVGSGIQVRKRLEAVVNKSDFVGPDNFALLVNPYAGGDINHAIEFGDDLVLVNQDSKFGIGLRDPGGRVFHSASVLSDRDDFKILLF